MKENWRLCIRDTHLWNMITISKLAWSMSQKKDYMWVKWVSELCVKDTPLGHYEAPNNASWA